MDAIAGEQLSKHKTITETDTLLMICPRFIIDRYSIINAWSRIVNILDVNYPKIDQVFDAFIQNRMWSKTRKVIVKSVKM